MAVPMALFGLVNWLVGFAAAIALLIVLGVSRHFTSQKTNDFDYTKIPRF